MQPAHGSRESRGIMKCPDPSVSWLGCRILSLHLYCLSDTSQLSVGGRDDSSPQNAASLSQPKNLLHNSRLWGKEHQKNPSPAAFNTETRVWNPAFQTVGHSLEMQFGKPLWYKLYFIIAEYRIPSVFSSKVSGPGCRWAPLARQKSLLSRHGLFFLFVFFCCWCFFVFFFLWDLRCFYLGPCSLEQVDFQAELCRYGRAEVFSKCVLLNGLALSPRGSRYCSL